jgi:hypothetical protein
MVVKYITPNGTRIHEPPYTKAEEADFYRRWNSGPLTVYRGDDGKAPKSQHRSRPTIA